MSEPQGMKTPLLTKDANENVQNAVEIMMFEKPNPKEKRRSDSSLLKPVVSIQLQHQNTIGNGFVYTNSDIKPSSVQQQQQQQQQQQTSNTNNTNSNTNSLRQKMGSTSSTGLAASTTTTTTNATTTTTTTTTTGCTGSSRIMHPNAGISHQMTLSPSLAVPAMLSSNTTLNGTSSSIFCRICYSNESKELLMNWCNCSGTMGLMHKSCLERWLSQSNTNNCEICKYEFKVDKVPRSFQQWLCRPISFRENKNLLNDLVCFLILTPLACISTWYCILFALKFHETENRWEASGLVVLTSFLLFIYVLWFFFSCKYHFKVFKEWQKKNQIVTIKMNEERVIIRQVGGVASRDELPTAVANAVLAARLQQQQQQHHNMSSTSTSTFATTTNQTVNNNNNTQNMSRSGVNDQLLNFDEDSIMNPDFSVISIDENPIEMITTSSTTCAIPVNTAAAKTNTTNSTTRVAGTGGAMMAPSKQFQLGIQMKEIGRAGGRLKRQSTLNGEVLVAASNVNNASPTVNSDSVSATTTNAPSKNIRPIHSINTVQV